MNIISRQAWGAKSPKNRVLITSLPVPKVWIHHTADSPGSDEIAHMKSVQNYHMKNKGWSDIGYSFVVYPSGNIYEGRGWKVVGAHTSGHNSSSHGICLAGNFQNQTPTIEALDAVRWLIHEGRNLGFIGQGNLPTGGHRDVASTACPGNNLYSYIGYLRQPWSTNNFQEEPMPFTMKRSQGGYVVIGTDGGVFAYDGAPFHGSLPGVGVTATIIGGDWTPSGNGYWLLGHDGAVFSFGDAAYKGGYNALPPSVQGGRTPVGLVTKGNGYVIIAMDPSGDGSPFDSYGFDI